MVVVNDIDKLSIDELIEALVLTRTCEDTTITNDLRSYYKLLSLDELKAKAAEGVLYCEEKPVQTTERELKRREIQLNQFQKKLIEQARRKPMSYVYVPLGLGKPGYNSKQHDMITELFIKKWIRDAVDIAPNVIGVRFEADMPREKGKKRVAKIAVRIGFTGEVVYG